MKYVIAIDSFKGSLSSLEAGNIASDAIKSVDNSAECKVFSLADGGEGTVDALVDGLGGEIVPLDVTGPLGKKVKSRFGFIPSTGMAVIEMADAAGLPMVPVDERNPMNTTTYGLGELILAAAEKGCREFIIGIGGSATNDAGLGMLTTLGAKFLDGAGQPVGVNGGDLARIEKIDLDGLHPVLQECKLNIACDVNNPLCGERGCSAVYGPQKGATPEIVTAMDKYIARFAQLAEKQCNVTGAEMAGAGAAGGLGYAFHAFLGATLKSGVALCLDAIGIEDSLKTADVFITGEGRIDRQTAMGKGPVGVAQKAKELNPQVITAAVCGCAADDAAMVNDHGIDAYFPILHNAVSVDEAMNPEVARKNLAMTVGQITRLVNASVSKGR